MRLRLVHSWWQDHSARFSWAIPYSHSGFTLVELLVVIGTIGILSVALLATLNPIEQIQKGKDAKRKSDLAQVAKALEIYYQDRGRYPAHSTPSPLYRIVRLDGTAAAWGEAFDPYMSKLPQDENQARTYLYYAPDPQRFYLFASLERGAKDQQACNGGLACLNVPQNVFCGSSRFVCNYGISSSNTSP